MEQDVTKQTVVRRKMLDDINKIMGSPESLTLRQEIIGWIILVTLISGVIIL